MVGYILSGVQLSLLAFFVSSRYCQIRDHFFSRGPEGSALHVVVGHQPKAMGKYPIAARGARAHDAGGVHSASWGDPRGGGRAKVAVGGNRPPSLVGDVVTFDGMREFLDAYSECEQQMHITNVGGGDRVLPRRRELVDSVGDPNECD